MNRIKTNSPTTVRKKRKREKGAGFIFYFEWSLALNILKPELPVKASILDGFRDVGGLDLLRSLKIGYGAGGISLPKRDFLRVYKKEADWYRPYPCSLALATSFNFFRGNKIIWDHTSFSFLVSHLFAVSILYPVFLPTAQ